jgi:hypothetical protein
MRVMCKFSGNQVVGRRGSLKSRCKYIIFPMKDSIEYSPLNVIEYEPVCAEIKIKILQKLLLFPLDSLLVMINP